MSSVRDMTAPADATSTRMSVFAGPTVLVTHSIADVHALASDVIVLESGSASYQGTVAGLLHADSTQYLRRLARGDAD